MSMAAYENGMKMAIVASISANNGAGYQRNENINIEASI
jgi:hypothetical protein